MTFRFMILGMSLLSLGTVVQKKDPIQLTQADPVGYQEKLKEEMEGKKGPPAPTLELFPKERFLVQSPMDPFPKDEAPELAVDEEGKEIKPDLQADDMNEDTLELTDESPLP